MGNAKRSTSTTIDLTAKQLERCEVDIADGLSAFYKVGKALARIRDERLYKGSYASFDAYCQDRWDIQRAYANEQIRAAQVVDNLDGIPSIPTTASQCRPLAMLETAEDQQTAWQQALELAGEGRVTAKIVQSAVNELLWPAGKQAAPAVEPEEPVEQPAGEPVVEQEKVNAIDALMAELDAANARIAELEALNAKQAGIIRDLEEDLCYAQSTNQQEPVEPEVEAEPEVEVEPNLDVDTSELDDIDDIPRAMKEVIKWMDATVMEKVACASDAADLEGWQVARCLIFEVSMVDGTGFLPYDAIYERNIMPAVQTEYKAGYPHMLAAVKFLKREGAKQFHPDHNGGTGSEMYSTLNGWLDSLVMFTMQPLPDNAGEDWVDL